MSAGTSGNAIPCPVHPPFYGNHYRHSPASGVGDAQPLIICYHSEGISFWFRGLLGQQTGGYQLIASQANEPTTQENSIHSLWAVCVVFGLYKAIRRKDPCQADRLVVCVWRVAAGVGRALNTHSSACLLDRLLYPSFPPL